MDLKHRLGTLRRQTGVSPQPAAPAVAERVARYRPGAQSGRSQALDPAALAERLGGALVDDGVILIEQRLPLQICHGGITLSRLLGDNDGLAEARGRDPQGLLFLDTETSGLAGGTGTVVFLLGLARIEQQHLVVHQYHLTRFGAEGAMLRRASAWLRAAECMVSYNGKCFDVPLLTTRFRLCGVHSPLERLAHLDLLHPTRRAFNRRWGDCRLATAERRLLGFERQDDLPGSEAPEAWFAWVRRQDPARLPGIARHNRWDVLSLAALIPALAHAYTEPGAVDADVAAVARGLRARGEGLRALQLLVEHRSMLDSDGLLELAALYRRANRWSEAQAIWEPLAAAGHVTAIERLAKYHEHVAGDPGAALAYAERLPRGPVHDGRRLRLQQRLAMRERAARGTPLP